MKATKQHVADALNLFELLEYGSGKAAAATVAQCTLAAYMKGELAPAVEARREARLFTQEEIAEMRAGRKLQAVKLVRSRLGKSLMESKDYVEANGLKYLMESGKYDSRAYYIHPSQY